MRRQDFFYIANLIAIVQAVLIYHYFWMDVGRYGFNLTNAIAVIIIIVIVVIGFNLARSQYLERKHSITMTIVYSSPFILYYIYKLVDDTASFYGGIIVLILFIAPLAVSSLIYGVSIFLKE